VFNQPFNETRAEQDTHKSDSSTPIDNPPGDQGTLVGDSSTPKVNPPGDQGTPPRTPGTPRVIDETLDQNTNKKRGHTKNQEGANKKSKATKK
jgi:hypothetical protein